MSDEADVTRQERAALEAWQVPEPPADFPSRVVARLEAEERRPWRIGAVAAVLAVVAAGGAVAVTGGAGEAEGSWEAKKRLSIALGDRGVAVAEAGSVARWQVTATGEARIVQSAGNVFYRVEPGGDFFVETDAGGLQVTGTCLRVEVHRMNRRTMGGAAIGALVGAVAVVTVYEGSVRAQSKGEAQEVAAGSSATLSNGRVTVRDRSPLPGTEPSRQADGAPPAGTEAAGAAGMEVPAPESRFAAEVSEVDSLRAQVERLQREVSELETVAAGRKTYDIPESELLAMADRCEVRWDWVVPDPNDPPGMGDEDAAKLKLTTEQREALQTVYAEYNEQMTEALNGLYVELTGDPNVGSMAVESMLSEAMDKTSGDETRRVYQAVAHERAGLWEPPRDLSGAPVFERMFRLVHGAGDGLEAQMAEAVGEDLAAQVRRLHGGFGSKSRMRNGCPGE